MPSSHPARRLFIPQESFILKAYQMGFAKLLYAASAWWGFTSADDKQRLAAFIRCSIRQGCSPDFANFSDIITQC